MTEGLLPQLWFTEITNFLIGEHKEEVFTLGINLEKREWVSEATPRFYSCSSVLATWGSSSTYFFRVGGSRVSGGEVLESESHGIKQSGLFGLWDKIE